MKELLDYHRETIYLQVSHYGLNVIVRPPYNDWFLNNEIKERVDI